MNDPHKEFLVQNLRNDINIKFEYDFVYLFDVI